MTSPALDSASAGKSAPTGELDAQSRVSEVSSAHRMRTTHRGSSGPIPRHRRVNLSFGADPAEGPMQTPEEGREASSRGWMPLGTAGLERVIDPRSTTARAETLPLDSPLPPLVKQAILLAARDDLAFSVACRLFVEDMCDSCPRDGETTARLEYAVARATLDAWRRGLGSCEGVGAAYAAVGDGLTRAKAGCGYEENELLKSASES